MELTISAKNNQRLVSSLTLSFPDMGKGLEITHMLEMIAKNHWQTGTVDSAGGNMTEDMSGEIPNAAWPTQTNGRLYREGLEHWITLEEMLSPQRDEQIVQHTMH